MFRPSALALPLAVLPLAIGWAMGGYGNPPQPITRTALGAHWIVCWLLPATIAAVLAYGTSSVRPDTRIMASGAMDLRVRWLIDNFPILIGVTMCCVALPVSLGQVTGADPFELAGPALAGALIACCVAQIVVARFGAQPSGAVGAAALICAVATVAPYLFDSPGFLVVDENLRRWMSGDPTPAPAVGVGTIVLPAVAILCAVALRYWPRDHSRLAWTTKETARED